MLRTENTGTAAFVYLGSQIECSPPPPHLIDL